MDLQNIAKSLAKLDGIDGETDGKLSINKLDSDAIKQIKAAIGIKTDHILYSFIGILDRLDNKEGVNDWAINFETDFFKQVIQEPEVMMTIADRLKKELNSKWIPSYNQRKINIDSILEIIADIGYLIRHFDPPSSF
jgi:hypothetical protein